MNKKIQFKCPSTTRKPDCNATVIRDRYTQEKGNHCSSDTQKNLKTKNDCSDNVYSLHSFNARKYRHSLVETTGKRNNKSVYFYCKT